jgi:hypothetical protein
VTHFLVSDSKPDGYRLEDILSVLRADVITRCNKISADNRPEARQVLHNNMRVLGLISEAIQIAEDSTRILEKAFGPSIKGGPPRIGSP